MDGRGPYTIGDAAALMAASMVAGKLPLDENHATDLAAPRGGAAPARGWIAELQARAEGIWGRVDWTGEGRRIVGDRQYRGVSPVILHDKAGRVTRILRASLTNVPNLEALVALHSEEQPMDFRAWLIETLGLAADTADEAVRTALEARLAARPDEVVALQSALPPIALAAGLDADADAAAVLAGVEQLRGRIDQLVIAWRSQIATVATRLRLQGSR